MQRVLERENKASPPISVSYLLTFLHVGTHLFFFSTDAQKSTPLVAKFEKKGGEKNEKQGEKKIIFSDVTPFFSLADQSGSELWD